MTMVKSNTNKVTLKSAKHVQMLLNILWIDVLDFVEFVISFF